MLSERLVAKDILIPLRKKPNLIVNLSLSILSVIEYSKSEYQIQRKIISYQ